MFDEFVYTMRHWTVKYRPWSQSAVKPQYPDGSFTMADSNSFLSPYEILPIALENKYLRKFYYFIMKLYVVCTRGDYNGYTQLTIIV